MDWVKYRHLLTDYWSMGVCICVDVYVKENESESMGNLEPSHLHRSSDAKHNARHSHPSPQTSCHRSLSPLQPYLTSTL